MAFPHSNKKAECELALRFRREKRIDSVCRVTNLLLDCLLVSFRGEFFGYGFLELFSVNPVAFGGVHKNVVATCRGSLISRIQQADFQKQLAEFGLIVAAHLLGKKFLRRRRVLLRLYLEPLCQSRDLVVREMANQVMATANKSAFFNGADARWRIVANIRWRVVMASFSFSMRFRSSTRSLATWSGEGVSG